jgi:beta-glucosidase-like glycosyl hydrolase
MLDINHKIYQLIINRLDGDNIRDSSYRERTQDLVRKGIGGFIIFGGNKDEVKEFIHSLQSISDIPLFIASDIERGAGQQFNGATHFPSMMAIAAAINRNDSSHVQLMDNYITSVAEEAIDIGITMPLIPVLDVNLNPDNPIICTRAFSDNPQTVSWFGRKYIDILQGAGLISCAKHFPGHGDTAIDSHISLPVIFKSEEDLMRADLIPFIEAITSGVGIIMMGHVRIPSIDTLSASLSTTIVTGLLRKKLGYTGLVMTDALNMSALNEFEDIPVKCIDAGVDIILHPADPIKTADDLIHAVDTGMLTEDQIETAFQRVMQYKSVLKTFAQINPDYDVHKNIAENLFNTSITLVSGKHDSTAKIDLNNVDLIFTGDDNRIDISTLKKQMPNAVHISQYKQNGNGKIIIALFTTVAAWQGSSGISDDDRAKIRNVISNARHSIVISFGSPYVLRHFKKADMLIAAYDSSVYAQKAVFECLKNNKGFEGSLPVKIDFF